MILSAALALMLCSSIQETKPAPLEPIELTGVAPLTRVGNVLLAGQPTREVLGALQGIGVTSVLDLRRAKEDRGYNEAAAVKALGMHYSQLPFGGPDRLTDAILDSAREQLREHRQKGAGLLLVHSATAVRVGAVWAASRVLDEGVPWDTAIAEARRAGLRSKSLEQTAWHYVLGAGVQALGKTKAEIRTKFAKVPRLTINELSGRMTVLSTTPDLLIDARASKEFAVSHLPGAQRATTVTEIQKLLKARAAKTHVVVYCSVGYRSAQLVERLHAAGITESSNLEGSIFEWANTGHPVFRDRTRVHAVHPYNDKWGQLLKREYWPKPKSDEN